MSAATEVAARPAGAAGGADAGKPSLLRLTLVELRKFADTRAGFWLLLLLFLLSIGLVALQLTVGNLQDRRLLALFASLQFPMSLLLPVLAILLVTSEWSQRTALTTFALVPQRGRIAAAKAAAVLVIALLGLVASLAAAAAGQALIPVFYDEAGSWSLPVVRVGELLVFQLFGMALGYAFALALQRSAPAIVGYLILPTAWTIAIGLVPSLADVGEWLDTSANLLPLIEGAADADAWLRLGTSAAVWIGIPLLIGLVRLRRSEFK